MKSIKMSYYILPFVIAGLYSTTAVCQVEGAEQVDASQSIEVPDASIDVEDAASSTSNSTETPVAKSAEAEIKKESGIESKKSSQPKTSSSATVVKSTSGSPSPEVPSTQTEQPEAVSTSAGPGDGSQDATSIFASEPGQISDGSRIKHPERGISIQPPTGWKVRSDMPGVTFFLKAPPGPPMSYQRNIVVVRFAGPSYVDQSAAEKMTKHLVDNFPAASPSISNYALRNFQKVQMADKREAILIYADFEDKGERMMQANVMVSGQDEHFLMSFTDRAEHFENSTLSAQFFNEPWTTLMSAELSTPSPVPTLDQWPLFVTIGVSALCLFAGISWYMRRRSQKMYEAYSNLDANDSPMTGTPLSLVGQNTTGDSMVFRKPSGKNSMVETIAFGKRGQHENDADMEDSLDKIQPSSKLDSRFEDELEKKAKNWKLG